MGSLLRDTELHRRIESAVEAAERETSAEVVVALAAASGSYRDVDYLAGASLAASSLAFQLFAPVDVHPYLSLPYVICSFVIGAAISGRFATVRRLFSTERRRVAQAHLHALVAFQQEGVSATRERNGLLIYVSLLERTVEILPDLAIDGKVPRATWNEMRHRILHAPDERSFADALVAEIAGCGALLKGAFPPGAENPNEIPNRPRIRE